jgi:O-antigen/teichoic acid export membrane protein
MTDKKKLLELNEILKLSFFKDNFLKNTWSIFQSFALRFVIQSIYFVILARTFGPEKYGAYVGIIAFISILIPFASWGSGEVLVQNAARNKELFREYFGTAIIKTIAFGGAFTLLLLLVYSFISLPHISIYSVFFLAIANLIFLKLSDTGRDACLAMGLMHYTGAAIIVFSLTRLLGILSFVIFFDSSSLFIWCVLYCVSTLVSALFSLILAAKTIGYPIFKLSTITEDIGLGFSFAIGTSAANIYNDLDKSMLAKLSSTQAAGIYAGAYHILSVALLPIQSLLYAAFRKFFQQGSSGIKSSFELCKKLLPLSLIYSLLAILGLYFTAPLLPIIIGHKYAESATALILLSPTIFFRTMHSFAADTLTGANFQYTRSTFQILVAVLNGLLNFCLIPRHGWYGAIWATLISEFFLMFFLWLFIYIYAKKANS